MAAGRPALDRANEACGVRNAATRKYLTRDWLWYWPPGEMIERLAALRQRARPRIRLALLLARRPGPVTAKEWDALRHRWRHAHGLTNVWQLAPLHGVERVKGTMRRAAPRVYNPSSLSAAHLNQKPLEFMHRILNAVTDPGRRGLGAVRRAGVRLGRGRAAGPLPLRRRARPRLRRDRGAATH